jgi:pyridoxal phosphate enzyme (YggS family)
MISDKLKEVEEIIEKKCSECIRNRSDITLIAVSKTQPIDVLLQAVDAGVRNFGENKAKELQNKSESISGNFKWHFIGHLQTNKVKYIIKASEYIHSVDSIKLAEEINLKAEALNKKQKILLEIKTSDEKAKLGLENENQIYEIAEFCKQSGNLDLVGLMTMAPYTNEKKIIRNCFIKLREIKEKLNKSGFGLSELSMGMTNDYDLAIEEGATMLRIGTAIFGEKNIDK